jgi:hypothetical protein
MSQAKHVKPVIILSLKKMGDRGEDLKEVLKCYASMFSDIDLISSANVFFTHTSGYTNNVLIGKFKDYIK